MVSPTPSAAAFTVSADLISGLIDCAAQCGVPRGRLADMLSAETNAKPGSPAATRFSGDHIFKLWERIVRLSGDPIIGHRMAFVATPKTFGVLGHIQPRCATVLEAYRQNARYVALASQGAQITVSTDADALTVTLALAAAPAAVWRAILVWGLTNLSLTPERYARVAIRPREIVCAAPSPGVSALHALSKYCPFRFDGEENRVVFDRSVGEIRIPTADPDLKALLVETMDRHLAALGPAASFEQGILTLLRSMINGNIPTLASLSGRCGMSQRTLQRRLTEANTTFQRLLQRVLHEASNELLARKTLSHGEIAFLLGYSDESAFSRAYRSWTGYPPGAAPVRQAIR